MRVTEQPDGRGGMRRVVRNAEGEYANDREQGEAAADPFPDTNPMEKLPFPPAPPTPVAATVRVESRQTGMPQPLPKGFPEPQRKSSAEQVEQYRDRLADHERAVADWRARQPVAQVAPPLGPPPGKPVSGAPKIVRRGDGGGFGPRTNDPDDSELVDPKKAAEYEERYAEWERDTAAWFDEHAAEREQRSVAAGELRGRDEYADGMFQVAETLDMKIANGAGDRREKNIWRSTATEAYGKALKALERREAEAAEAARLEEERRNLEEAVRLMDQPHAAPSERAKSAFAERRQEREQEMWRLLGNDQEADTAFAEISELFGKIDSGSLSAEEYTSAVESVEVRHHWAVSRAMKAKEQREKDGGFFARIGRAFRRK